jgi:atypical dual specificity phosphatase
MLSMSALCVRRHGRPLLQDVSLDVDSPGLLFLVGPGGVGKSSLLAALADASSSDVVLDGSASLDGQALPGNRVATVWIPQHARLQGEASVGDQMRNRFGLAADRAQQILVSAGFDDTAILLAQPAVELSRSARRVVAVLAGLASAAQLYLVDEPTADMSDEHAAAVRRRLKELAARAMAVVATHNRQDCIGLGGATALIAGGTLQEVAPSHTLFSTPATAAARTYVDTGNCSLRSRVKADQRNGIWWLEPGLLCGMSRPGLVSEIGSQYDILHDSGVRHLICLEERWTTQVDQARRREIACHHFGMADMAPPSFCQAVDICRLAEPAIKANQGVALHCRGGLGRTGTALAAILIWFGDDPDAAVAKVRDAQPHAIQSPAQERFLHEFARRIRAWH